ncbi:STAS domain-containing protein [Streptomyces sp. SLBN-115]|uniref:STAS domain-containing protein n=1 Tax=Streptomyces sp. SLBN-115 TaxID=2768453 RepID=UPI0011510634|nr:STAS domain-containing protein [Streptomyces sp. SLBN-115]TQJ56008.1 anti-anti-sigma factor [Streptomyces sp. SLBN-115]
MSGSEETGKTASTEANREVGRVSGQYEAGGAWVVVAHGDFDAACMGTLARALEEGAATHPRLVLDATAVGFADSTFLNALVQASHAADLRLVAPGPLLRRVLEITGVDQVIGIYPSVDSATAQ